jgi:hypothetical protein
LRTYKSKYQHRLEELRNLMLLVRIYLRKEKRVEVSWKTAEAREAKRQKAIKEG